MENRRKYRVYCILAALLFLLKAAAYHEDLQIEYLRNCTSQSKSVITNVKNNLPVDMKQADEKRVWLYITNTFDYAASRAMFLLSFIYCATIIACILLHIDVRRRIMEQNTIWYNGSKYKGAFITS